MNVNLFFEKVKEFEGFRAKAYKCPSGVLTIGYGHTQGVIPEMDFTKDFSFEEVATSFLRYDVLIVYVQLKALHSTLVFASPLGFALTDFVFNVGITKYKRSTLKKVVDNIKDCSNLTENDIASLSVQFNLWCYANGKKLRGLEKRRQWEISLLYE